jgi:hypothetical protein
MTLVEISVDKNSTVVFPALLMSAIEELGAFVTRETRAAAALPVPPMGDGKPPLIATNHSKEPS